MSNTKTGLLYSELTERIYWGTVNTKTGIARSGKKDVTSDFISVMLQKFPPNFKQNIECNGEFEAEIIVLGKDNKNRARFAVAKEMEEMLAKVVRCIEDDSLEDFLSHYHETKALLAKARGEL